VQGVAVRVKGGDPQAAGCDGGGQRGAGSLVGEETAKVQVWCRGPVAGGELDGVQAELGGQVQRFGGGQGRDAVGHQA
jgi:hypothetical protein